MHKIGEFQILGAVDVILYCKAVGNYIMYDVPFKLHKTCRWSPTSFLMYTFENSDSRQRGNKNNQHKYLVFCSKFLYTCYFNVFYFIPTIIDQLLGSKTTTRHKITSGMIHLTDKLWEPVKNLRERAGACLVINLIY